MVDFPSELPSIDGMNVVLVNQCNLHCITCAYPLQASKKFVRREVLNQVVQDLLPRGLSRIDVSGGEPSLHPEFCEVIDDLYNAGLDITLVTNGTHLSKFFPRLAGKLARCIISIDADNADLYEEIRGSNVFDALCQLPSLFAEGSPSTHMTFAVVVQRKNFRRIPNMFAFAKRCQVQRVSFLCPDIPSLVAPDLRNTGAFGHVSAVQQSQSDSIILDLEEIREFREVVIPAVKGKIYEFPEFANKTIDMLDDFANYFEAYRRQKPRPEFRKCALPFNEIVLDENENLRFCFYMPDRWHYYPGMDVLNHHEAVKARVDYLKNDTRCHKYCNTCLQAVRIPADILPPATPIEGYQAFDPLVPDRNSVQLRYSKPEEVIS